MDYPFLLKPSRKDAAGSRQRLLYTNLRQAITTGRLGPKHRLPSSREMAEQLSIARNTVVHAYEQLCAEGYLLSDRRGTAVAELPRPPRNLGINRQAPRLSSRARQLPVARERGNDLGPFTPGVPALDAFPLSEWQGAIKRVFREIRPRDLAYGTADGNPSLRVAISDRLRAARGLRCSPDQVFITDGTQAALDICARLLAEETDVVWMEDPGYTGARSVFTVAGLNIQPVAVDASGMTVSDLHDYPAPRFIYLTPSHQYPLGGVLSMPRRLELLALAHKHGAWILEDDYDSDFRYDGEPLAALQGLIEDAPVIYMGTFSKTLFPGLRLGYFVAPPELVAPLQTSLASWMRHGRQLEEDALARFMMEGRYTRHLSRMRRLYRERRQALRAALARYLPDLEISGADAGLHLVVLLPAGIDDLRVCKLASEQGLNPQPLRRYYHEGSVSNPGLLLGYGNTPASTMNRHVRTLAACIANARS